MGPIDPSSILIGRLGDCRGMNWAVQANGLPSALAPFRALTIRHSYPALAGTSAHESTRDPLSNKNKAKVFLLALKGKTINNLLSQHNRYSPSQIPIYHKDYHVPQATPPYAARQRYAVGGGGNIR